MYVISFCSQLDIKCQIDFIEDKKVQDFFYYKVFLDDKIINKQIVLKFFIIKKEKEYNKKHNVTKMHSSKSRIDKINAGIHVSPARIKRSK